MSNWLSEFIPEDVYIIKDQKIQQTPPVEKESAPKPVKETTRELGIIVDENDLSSNKELLNAILGSIDKSLEEASVIAPNSTVEGDHQLLLDFSSEGEPKYALGGSESTRINSDTLGALAADRNLKLKLWAALKEFKNLQKSQ